MNGEEVFLKFSTSSEGGGGGGTKKPLPKTYFTSPLVKLSSGQACLPCKGSCSPIPGRSCSGDIPADGIVEPPPPFVERLSGVWMFLTVLRTSIN